MNQNFAKKALFAACCGALAALLPRPDASQQTPAQQTPAPTMRVIEKGEHLKGAVQFNEADLAGKACTVQTIACGQTVSGTLDSADCSTSNGTYADLYQFPGTSGQ